MQPIELDLGMMNNNNHDPNLLQLQRLLAAQNAERELSTFGGGVSANPLLEQFSFLGGLHDRFSFPQASHLGLSAHGRVNQQQLSMLQAMMFMNNQSAALNSERERLFAERAINHERALLSERLAQHERILLNNEFNLKRSIHEASIGREQPKDFPQQEQQVGEIYDDEEVSAEGDGTPGAEATSSSQRKKLAGSIKVQNPKKKQDTKWLASYEELKEYKAEYHDCIVPRGYPLNPKLASWVAEQRKQYKLLQDKKNSSITPRRIQLLEELGFAWNAQEAAWERHIRDLKQFKAEYGDCLVPLNHPSYPKLGLWVKEQRRHYTLMNQNKASHMTQERARALDEIGFCWDTHEAVWGERLRELCQYKATFGDCIVPTNYTNNPKLGTWVHHQRRQYKKYKEGKACHITAERIRALESIGFVWYPRDRSRYPEVTSSDSDTESDAELQDFDLRPSKRQRTNSTASSLAP